MTSRQTSSRQTSSRQTSSRQTSSRQTSSHQTSSRQTSSVSQAKSASYEVGYGKPPRHTQFTKGKSGNPGGRRPRQNWPIEPVERLKELTLREAYRGIVIKQENGVGMPAFAIQAILRSQMELAMGGNARAQRDILKAVQTFERENAQALAAKLSREEVETMKKQLEDIRATWFVMREIEEAHADEEDRFAAWAKHMMRQARKDFADEDAEEKEETPEREAAKGGTVPAREANAQEREAKRQAAVPAPSSTDHDAPRPVPPACDPPVRDKPAAEEPPVSTKFRPRKDWKPGPDRYARHPFWERTGFRRRRRTGDRASPPGVTWNAAVSRHGPRQKSKNSLLNSLFSGNPIPVRSRSFLSVRRVV